MIHKPLKSLALPRGLREARDVNILDQSLGKDRVIDFQCVSETSPKPSGSLDDKPDLIVDSGDLPATAREVRDLLSSAGDFFDRGMPVKVVKPVDGSLPRAIPLSFTNVVIETHRVCRPVRPQGEDELVPVTLPDRVARMYLSMTSDWQLQPLIGITTAPILGPDGAVRAVNGFDPETKLWCANLPAFDLPEHPSRAEAESALHALRDPFRTFPFGDAKRRPDKDLGVDVVDIDQSPGLDESGHLVGLLTAICRANLGLAPGLMVRAPEISGAGTGKGLLVRAISAIAFGVSPRAFTKGGDRQELDKRLASDLIEAAPIVFLDNVNGSILRSDTLASVLTERPARVRPLGRTGMVALNSTAFIAVTGNGLTVSEDLARRFVVCELDGRCEHPEQRRFGSGFLDQIGRRRAELLGAALTIWRWGRQNVAALQPGRALGSFENWAEWCRDPLVALGCRDPVERIDSVKADDPHRRRIVELFDVWHQHHGERPIKAVDLAEPVQALVDPQGRSRQFIAARIRQLTGTRAGGFVLSRQEAVGRWSAATYALRRT
jgi:putative DNA primase/helicase